MVACITVLHGTLCCLHWQTCRNGWFYASLICRFTRPSSSSLFTCHLHAHCCPFSFSLWFQHFICMVCSFPGPKRHLATSWTKSQHTFFLQKEALLTGKQNFFHSAFWTSTRTHVRITWLAALKSRVLDLIQQGLFCVFCIPDNLGSSRDMGIFPWYVPG